MAFTTYAKRCPAHPTRCGAKRDVGGIRLLVIHTSEGAELPTSAEALARFIGTPKTVDPLTGKTINVASYHYIADTDCVMPVVPDDCVAFANAGANHDGLSICYPGKAGQSIDQWHDANSDAMHEQVARWLADQSRRYKIPLTRLSAGDVKAGRRGVCGHNEVSLAFKASTHTDPGPSFPWAAVLERARRLLAPPIPNPPEEAEVAKLLLRAPDNTLYITDRYSYAHVVTKEPEEAEHLRDRVGAVCRPDGGPWPCDQLEADYLARLAGRDR